MKTAMEKTTDPDLFCYTDYRSFLKDLCSEKQKRNPHFSYRYISNKINIKSTGFFSSVLQGKRNLSERIVLDLTRFLRFNVRQTEYFTLLVKYNQAKTHDERRYAFDKLFSMRRGVVRQIEQDQYEFYQYWYCSALRELTEIIRVNDHNLQEIADMLSPPISLSEIRNGIEILVRLGMLRKTENGSYERVDEVITSGGQVQPVVIQNFQISCMELARRAFDAFEKRERQMSTITMSVDKNGYERILQKLAATRDEIMEIARSAGKPDRIMQLNMQYFPLTRSKPDHIV